MYRSKGRGYYLFKHNKQAKLTLKLRPVLVFYKHTARNLKRYSPPIA